MKTISAGVLDVAYEEYGPEDGAPVVLLHGFPYDVHDYDAIAPRLADAGKRCIVPYMRGYGPTRFHDAATFRSGQQAAFGADLTALLDALGLERALLGGFDWGGRAACVVAALQPHRVAGLVTCGTAYNVQNCETATAPVAPEAERRYWYWYYLNSERGRTALMNERREFCRFLWHHFSPTWKFEDATFDRTAPSFDNPDFARVVVHSYRYRIGEVPGDPAHATTERRLAARPQITVPTIALAGDDDGVEPPKPLDAFAGHFTDLRRYTTLPRIGHDVPREAPDAFVAAVLELTG